MRTPDKTHAENQRRSDFGFGKTFGKTRRVRALPSANTIPAAFRHSTFNHYYMQRFHYAA